MPAPHSPRSSVARSDSPSVGLHAPAELRAGLVDLLTAIGLEVSDPREGADQDTPVIAVWSGWPPAHATDPWLREPRPHLVVALGASQARVGPFVDPGLTACLRCLEAEGALRSATLPGEVPHDPGVLALAGALAAHDVQRWYAGRVPATWSATLTVDARLDTSRHTWLRHPHCGCSWWSAADLA